MNQNFTHTLKQVLTRAADEARRFKHHYIGTEHLLLALAGDETGIVADALRVFGVDANRIRAELQNLVTPGTEPVEGDIPLTPRARTAIEFARDEARIAREKRVGPDLLLLGLVHEPDGVAGQVLRKLGLSLDALRREVLRIRLFQIRIVERAVRPLRTTTSEKRRIREELLAHLESICDDERARLGDSNAALREASLRFGDPALLSRELQHAVTAPRRFGYMIERIFGWRAPETAMRYLLRQAVLSAVLMGVIVSVGLVDELNRLSWDPSAWITARPLLMIMILVPIDQFVLGLLYYKLRDSMYGVFGARKSTIAAKLYAIAIGCVIALSLGALCFWNGTLTIGAATIVFLVSIVAGIGYFRLASGRGFDEIADTIWACLDLGESAKAAPGE